MFHFVAFGSTRGLTILRKKIILFFTCEPGGAEVLIPAIRLLNEHDYFYVIVLAYGYALERFKRKKVDFKMIFPIEKNDFDIMDKYSPNLIITSATSIPNKDMSEKYLWFNAKRRSISTLAFLDHWQNYCLRFSGKNDSEYMKYLPDNINCINDIAKEEMINQGFNAEILHTFGHPYLSGLKKEIEKIDLASIQSTLNIHSQQKTILFASEAIYENFGNTRGYNQYEVIDLFLRYCAEAFSEDKIIIKLHPKDILLNYQSTLKKYNNLNLKIVTNELSPADCIAISDRVFGMTSLMLIEAYILGKPVISVQPNLIIEDPLVLSRYGYIPKVSQFIDFFVNTELKVLSKKFNYKFLKKKFLEFIENILE